jgi:mannose-6-phosphate isomerase-like protein (cupin superfamily)
MKILQSNSNKPKAWGHTTKIMETDSFEIHKIFVEKGGYCSIHRHAGKNNSFYILFGVLQLTEWGTGDVRKDRVLKTNELYTCKQGIKHQFRALSEVGALEIYHTCINPDDIIRYSEGGLDEEN